MSKITLTLLDAFEHYQQILQLGVLFHSIPLRLLTFQDLGTTA